jgi:hypothetical protein
LGEDDVPMDMEMRGVEDAGAPSGSTEDMGSPVIVPDLDPVDVENPVSPEDDKGCDAQGRGAAQPMWLILCLALFMRVRRREGV